MPGLIDGRLAPPPPSPNCVSSEADPADKVHATTPLPLHGDPATAITRLGALLRGLPRVVVLTERPDYLHATFTTRWIGWVDDLELRLDAQAAVLHIRSASRVGWGDLGANRKRVRLVRELWENARQP